MNKKESINRVRQINLEIIQLEDQKKQINNALKFKKQEVDELKDMILNEVFREE